MFNLVKAQFFKTYNPESAWVDISRIFNVTIVLFGLLALELAR